MTPSKYQALVDKIVEANPEIMELKFGCKVDTGAFSYRIMLNENQCIALHPVLPLYELQGTPYQIYKVIGRDIVFDDVIITLRNKNDFYPSQEKKLIEDWTFGKHLHLQNEETQDWLYSVIVKK